MARPPKPWYWSERDGWYVTVGGERKLLAKGKAAKAEAVDLFHEIMAQRSALRPIDSRRQTVATVIEAYLAFAKKRVSPRQFDNLTSVLQRFAQAHGYRDVDQCKPIHLTQWIDAQPKWKSDWTLYRVVATVVRPFRWAARERLIRFNPFEGASHAPGMPRRPITDEEFQSLLRGAPGKRGRPFRQLLIFLRYTGCRPAEAASLKWEYINTELGVIVLPAHKTARKTRKPRSLPMVPVVVRLLIHLKKHAPPGRAHVFVNDRRNPWHRSALSLRLQRCRDRQKIPAEATLYGIRHQFGTRAIMNGVDLKTLASLMGHENTRMTEHYLHLGAEAAHLALAMQQATGRRRDAQTPTERKETAAKEDESPAPQRRGKRQPRRG